MNNDLNGEVTREICNPLFRQEFVYVFEVIKSNPNGDPDAMNAPRTIADTGHGLVSDVSIKRKLRDVVLLSEPEQQVFIQSDEALNEKKRSVAEDVKPQLTKDEREGKKPVPRLGAKLCELYYDIRMFGAVLATGEKGDRLNAGKVTGPIQINWATSLDPVAIKYNSNSRNARTTDKRMESGETEFGITTPIIPYAVYRTHGFVSPYLAEQTGVSSEDMRIFWLALYNAFELTKSRSRPEINVRGLTVFTHDSKLGRAPAHKLLDRVQIQLREDIETPQNYEDYVRTVREHDLPEGVRITHIVDPRESSSD